jgi:hypothetical protein
MVTAQSFTAFVQANASPAEQRAIEQARVCQHSRRVPCREANTCRCVCCCAEQAWHDRYEAEVIGPVAEQRMQQRHADLQAELEDIYQGCGADLGWDTCTPSDTEFADVISDLAQSRLSGVRLTLFNALGPAERAALLRKVGP